MSYKAALEPLYWHVEMFPSLLNFVCGASGLSSADFRAFLTSIVASSFNSLILHAFLSGKTLFL